MGNSNNNVPLELLGLSVRSYNCLKRAKINTLGELMSLSTEEMLEIRNLGKTSAAELMELMRKVVAGEIKFDNGIPEETYASISASGSDYKKDSNIIRVGKKKVLHHINETTILKEVQNIMFYDAQGILVDDLDVSNMQLSTRAVGTLLRNGYTKAKQVVEAEYTDIVALKSMGATSLNDIMDKLKEITFVQFKSAENSQLIERYAEVICDDIRENCPRIKEALYVSQVKVAVYKNEALLTDEEDYVLENRELLNAVYSDASIYKIFENYICTILLELSTLPLFSLKQRMPVGLRNSDVFMQMINNLTAKRRVDYTESGLQYHLLTVLDYTKLMEEGNQKTALMCRLQGMTLEEAGNVIGVTRERVRQLTKKALEKMPKLREDDFKYWFENYDITKEEFKNIFGLTEESYNYLKGTYKKGTKSLEELLIDENITRPIAQKAEKEMYKYCVLIEGEYVPIKREPIIRKLFQVNYSDKDCAVSEFYELYLDFLKTNGLEDNEKLLHPSERAFEARLDDQRYTLIKYGRKVRYYNMDEYDLDILFAELQLEAYQGLEISTAKLFNTHRELMEEYDIMDEYELHNLMKKNEDKLPYPVTLGRMPLISIGEADREQQVVQLLYRIAPVDFYGYGNAYEEEYGVKSETVLANFAQYIDRYYNNGTYSIDYVVMTPDEYRILGSKLTEDFYFIEDIKVAYVETFPNGDISKVNPFNLKTMGFRVYVDYIVRDTYSSSDVYFRQLLTRNDIIDLDRLDKRMGYNQVFAFVLEELRVNFDLLEFERNKYLSFERFSKGAPDISKEDLKQFTLDVATFEDEEFFTIKSVRRKGFTSKIDDIGFDEWFYSALLRSNKSIRYSKAGGTFLFSHIDRQFKLGEFFYFLMKRFRKIGIMKFIDYIYDVYGLKFEKAKVTYIISQTSMYYDSTMEKVYLNKEEYYEDI